MRGENGRRGKVGGEDLGKMRRGEGKGLLVEAVGGFVGRNRERNLTDNGAVIGQGIDLKKGDCGGGFAVYYLPGAGSGTTIFGERRGVDVNDFVNRDINQFLGKERRTEGNHQAKVGLELGKKAGKVLVKNVGLDKVEMMFLGKIGDGVWGYGLLATDRFVGFGDDADKAILGQGK